MERCFATSECLFHGTSREQGTFLSSPASFDVGQTKGETSKETACDLSASRDGPGAARELARVRTVEQTVNCRVINPATATAGSTISQDRQRQTETDRYRQRRTETDE